MLPVRSYDLAFLVIILLSVECLYDHNSHSCACNGANVTGVIYCKWLLSSPIIVTLVIHDSDVADEFLQFHYNCYLSQLIFVIKLQKKRINFSR